MSKKIAELNIFSREEISENEVIIRMTTGHFAISRRFQANTLPDLVKIDRLVIDRLVIEANEKERKRFEKASQ